MFSSLFTAADVIVITGDPAPDAAGTIDGAFSSPFSRPVLNDAGQTLFFASVEIDPHLAPSNGLFRSSTDSVMQIARRGQSVTQFEGEFRGFYDPLTPLNNQGQALFAGSFKITPRGQVGQPIIMAANDSGLYIGSGTPESLKEVVRESDDAPGSVGFNGRFGEFRAGTEIALNNSAQVAFLTDLLNTARGSDDDVGIFRGDDSGNVAQIVREGDSLLGESEEFTLFTLPMINDDGLVAFSAQRGDSVRLDGIFVGDGVSPPKVIAQVGDSVPGGGTFGDFAQNPGVPISNRGEVVFAAEIEIPGPNSKGIFRSNGNQITEVLREGQTLANGDALFQLNSSGVALMLNENGDVALIGTVDTNTAKLPALLRVNSEGDVVQIARKSQRVPANDASIFNVREFAMNDAGQFAFMADLLEDSGNGGTVQGLFFYDDQVGLLEIVREGDIFNGTKINDILFHGVEAGELLSNNSDGLNADGHVAFAVTLASDEQIVAVVDPLEPNGNDNSSVLIVSTASLDLSSVDLSGVGEIDMTGNGVNALQLTVGDVLRADNDRLIVRSDPVDIVSPGSGWTFSGTSVRDGKFVRRFSQNDAVLQLVGPHDWTNPINALDVNADGFVAPIDVLLVINEINGRRYSAGGLPNASGVAPFPNRFFDTAADGIVAPNDVLVIINHLNRHGSTFGGEGEAFADFADVALAHPSRDTGVTLSVAPQNCNVTTHNPPRPTSRQFPQGNLQHDAGSRVSSVSINLELPELIKAIDAFFEDSMLIDPRVFRA